MSEELRAKFERLKAVAHGDVAEHTLNQLLYAQLTKGESVRVYLFDADGYHRGGQWAARDWTRNPEEVISLDLARHRVEEHIAQGLEVRICDGGDYLIFHSRNGVVLYPDHEHVAAFWNRL